METKKLFVGGLSWGMEWQDLKDLFKTYGEVVFAKIIKDRDTGKSKGYGFVEFECVECAVKAKEEMNGKELDSRILKVDFAVEKTAEA